MKTSTFLITLLLVAGSFSVKAGNDKASSASDSVSQDSATTAAAAEIRMQDSIMQSFNYQSGHIDVGTVAAVDVPEGFKFLSSQDAKVALWKLWNNPPSDYVLGMLVPDSIDFMAPESWAIVYSYDEDGYVKDDDAAKINYSDLLETMIKESKEDNVNRIKEGYGSLELVGWAEEPHYDKASHKLHWAKKLRSDGDSIGTLNYNIRMLGRKGVLVMNVIAGMDALPVVKSKMNTILASTNFTSGNRYEDFDDKIDKVAEYGIGGLVAGAVLLKTGLLAKIGLILLKAWKAIALGAVALFGFFRKKLFAKKQA
jgi:uncharacterized membrane-anchored protein